MHRFVFLGPSPLASGRILHVVCCERQVADYCGCYFFQGQSIVARSLCVDRALHFSPSVLRGAQLLHRLKHLSGDLPSLGLQTRGGGSLGPVPMVAVSLHSDKIVRSLFKALGRCRGSCTIGGWGVICIEVPREGQRFDDGYRSSSPL